MISVYAVVHKMCIITIIFTLGLFYFTLGNIIPKYRSSLKSIYLLGVVKSSIVSEYGFAPILKPFIDDVNHLAVSGFGSKVNVAIVKCHSPIV